jgi:hypothetical protein
MAGAIDVRIWAVVPLNGRGFEALLRCPHVIGDHGNRFVRAHDLTNSLDGSRCCRVQGFRLAAERR